MRSSSAPAVTSTTTLLLRASTLLVVSLLATAACSSQATTAPAQSTAPVFPGSGVTGFDQGFCNADQQREQRCASQQTFASGRGGMGGMNGMASMTDPQRCIAKSCQLRTTHGVEIAQAIDNCLLQRPCGEHNQDACHTIVLGAHAATPTAQQAFARCNPFEQKCSGLTEGHGKSITCAFVAQLGPEMFAAINPCFDLACGLGQQCIAGQFARANVACDVPRSR